MHGSVLLFSSTMYARVGHREARNKILWLTFFFLSRYFQDDMMKQLSAKRDEQIAARGLPCALQIHHYRHLKITLEFSTLFPRPLPCVEFSRPQRNPSRLLLPKPNETIEPCRVQQCRAAVAAVQEAVTMTRRVRMIRIQMVVATRTCKGNSKSSKTRSDGVSWLVHCE
jgi:hypothetical protein